MAWTCSSFESSPRTPNHQDQVTTAHRDGHYRRARLFRYEKVPLPWPVPARDPLAGHLRTPETQRCCSWATSPRRCPGPLDGQRAAGQERRLDGQDHQDLRGPGGALGRQTSPSAGTANPPRPRRPSINWTTSPASRRSWPSPRNGDHAAAWRPATCSPPPSNPPRHYRSPGTGALNAGFRSGNSAPTP